MLVFLPAVMCNKLVLHSYKTYLVTKLVGCCINAAKVLTRALLSQNAYEKALGWKKRSHRISANYDRSSNLFMMNCCRSCCVACGSINGSRHISKIKPLS